jgi:hypothetical protein
VPFSYDNKIGSDVCPPAGNAWVAAIHSYHRSLPGNRSPC